MGGDDSSPLKSQEAQEFQNSDPLKPKEVQEFQALTGALIWLVVCTRPDIAYAVSLLSRAVAKPTKAHAGLGKRILRSQVNHRLHT
ncbi:unnamed protein product [Chrysoparadoxa australica]